LEDEEEEIKFEVLANVRFENAMPDSDHPLTISGVLVSKSGPIPFTRTACFHCTDDCCPNNSMECYVHRRVPWVDSCSEWNLDLQSSNLDLIKLGDQAKCSLCESNIEEIPSKRIVTTAVVGIIVKSAETFGEEENQSPWKRQQGQIVIFSDEWTQYLHLGGMYQVIGEEYWCHSGKKCVVECLNLRPQYHSVTKWMLVTECDQMQLSPYLMELYATSHESSPWSFALSLTYEFGHSVCPKHTYFKLKLALLLSLVSVSGVGSASEDWPLPVMTVAYDTTLPSRLMSYGSDLVESSAAASQTSLLPDHFDLRIDTKDGPVKMTNCGGLLAATGGVLRLGEMAAITKRSANDLKKVLETGRVPLPSQDEEVLATAVWTHCSLPIVKGDVTMAKQKEAFFKAYSPLINVFGSVYFCDSVNSNENNGAADSIALMTLKRALGVEDQNQLSHEELRHFILQVRERRVVIEDETSELLKNYFVSCRRRAKAADHTDRPYQSALKTITTMAESFAKLSLRRSVTVYDAGLAIFMYEENLVAASATTSHSEMLHVTHKPHYPEEFSAMEVIQSLDQFMRDLILFNETYTGDLSLATQSCAATTSTMATPTKNTPYDEEEEELFEE